MIKFNLLLLILYTGKKNKQLDFFFNFIVIKEKKHFKKFKILGYNLKTVKNYIYESEKFYSIVKSTENKLKTKHQTKKCVTGLD